MSIDYSLIIVALGNVGAVGIVGKYLLKGVEKSNENLPVILHAIKSYGEAIDKLLTAHARHDQDLTEIKITHKINGCDQPHRRQEDNWTD